MLFDISAAVLFALGLIEFGHGDLSGHTLLILRDSHTAGVQIVGRRAVVGNPFRPSTSRYTGPGTNRR